MSILRKYKLKLPAMKALMLMVCIILSIQCKSQFLTIDTATTNLDTLIMQARNIMYSLSFAIRKNIMRDDPLIIKADTSKKGMSAEFRPNTMQQLKPYPPLDTLGRFYKKEYFLISKIVYEIVFIKKECSRKERIQALATFIHEIVHYLQASYLFEYGDKEIKTRGELKTNMMLSVELEAYSVDSYFILNFLNKDKLRSILKIKANKKQRAKLLINAANKEVYPNMKPVFP